MKHLDDLEKELEAISDAMDDADGTKFGELAKLLDKTAAHASRAAFLLKEFRRTENA